MLLKRLKWIAIGIAAFFLILGIALFASRGWIEDKIHSTLESQLTSRGIHLKYTPSDFDLFRGVVLEDATLFRTEAQTEPVITLSSLAISYQLRDLLFSPDQRRVEVSTQDATLTAFHEGVPFALEALDSQFSISPAGVVIAQLDGQMFDLELNIEGEVDFPESSETTPDAESLADDSAEDSSTDPLAELDLSPLADFAEAWKLKITDERPKLSLGLDLAADQTLKAEGSLSGKDFSWDGVPIDQLMVDFDLKEGADPVVILVNSLQLTYGGNPLTAAAEFDTGTQTLLLQNLDSKIDVIDLASQFSKEEADSTMRFLAPPHLIASGTIPVATPELANLKGTATCSKGIEIAFPESRNLLISNLTTSFTLKDGSLQLPDFSASTLDGKAEVNASFRVFDDPLTLQGTVGLHELSLAALSKFAGQSDDKMGNLSATFQGGGAPDLTKLKGNGTLTMSEAYFVSIPIFRKLQPLLGVLSKGPFEGKSKGTSLTSTYQLGDGALTTDDVVLTSGVFLVEATANVNFATEELQANAVAKTRGATQLISELAGKSLEIEASGTFQDYQWKLKNVPGVGEIGSLSDLAKKKGGELLEGLGLNTEGADDSAETLSGMAQDAVGNLPFLRGLKPKPEGTSKPESAEKPDAEEKPVRALRPGQAN